MDSQTDNRVGQQQELSPEVPAEVPVLIVGGGPVGLTSSLLLSHHGIRSLLVEQHPSTSTYPKAHTIKTRMMEIFRQLGIEQAIRDVAIPHTRNMIFMHSLTGEEIHRRTMETVLPEFVRNWSPTGGCTSPQDVVEPVLLAHARQHEQAQIRFSTQLASLEQRDDQVLATLVHRPSGRVQQVRAQYLIGTDGSHSLVREALGIHMVGQPVLSYYINILFRADLSRWVQDRELKFGFITNPEAAGMLVYNGGDRWRFTAFYDPAKGQRPEDFLPDRCLQILRTAVGAPDLEVELGEITVWNDAAMVAERFYDRRVFLAGDSEHVMSPMGGFALNVGVEDAQNLAWKLAAVLKCWAPPALLESYELERVPVSRRIIEQSTRNSSVMHEAGNAYAKAGLAPQPPWTRPELGREHGLVFGTTYNSPVIIPDGTSPIPVANPVTDYVPNASPGSRAPHVWLEQDGRRISTLDLFGSGFVMLTASAGRAWSIAASEIAQSHGVPFAAYSIGPNGDFNCPEGVWKTTYGIEEDGAVLVRPDGYVAWRSLSGAKDVRHEIDRTLKIATGNLISKKEAVVGSRV